MPTTPEPKIFPGWYVSEAEWEANIAGLPWVSDTLPTIHKPLIVKARSLVYDNSTYNFGPIDSIAFTGRIRGDERWNVYQVTTMMTSHVKGRETVEVWVHP